MFLEIIQFPVGLLRIVFLVRRVFGHVVSGVEIEAIHQADWARSLGHVVNVDKLFLSGTVITALSSEGNRHGIITTVHGKLAGSLSNG